MLLRLFRFISRRSFASLYRLSDCLFVVAYHLVRYRRKVVRKNLRAAFPEKSDAERRAIERRFYHWFCDYLVETIKLLTITPDEMRQHMEFRGFEQLEEALAEGQDVAALLGHYCNWEWLSGATCFLRRCPDAVLGLIYHPLRQKAFDEAFIEIRSQLGGVCVPKNATLRHLARYRKADRRTMFGYIADQSPKWENIHLWLDFLHQDTPVFTGAERIARKMNNAVFYLDIDRPERGRYTVTFHLISRHPADEDEYAITREYFRLLEQTIRRRPEHYLWTHNRWKRQRPAPEQAGNAESA